MKLLLSVIIGAYLMRKHGIAEMALASLGIYIVLTFLF